MNIADEPSSSGDEHAAGEEDYHSSADEDFAPKAEDGNDSAEEEYAEDDEDDELGKSNLRRGAGAKKASGARGRRSEGKAAKGPVGRRRGVYAQADSVEEAHTQPAITQVKESEEERKAKLDAVFYAELGLPPPPPPSTKPTDIQQPSANNHASSSSSGGGTAPAPSKPVSLASLTKMVPAKPKVLAFRMPGAKPAAPPAAARTPETPLSTSNQTSSSSATATATTTATATAAAATAAAAAPAKPTMTASPAGDGKVTVKRTFDFAGEAVTVEERVDAATAERLERQKRKAEDSQAAVGGILQVLGKKKAMGTLDKSRLDWDSYKAENNIEEDKHGEGYLDKVAFLQRTEMREYELELAARRAREAQQQQQQQPPQ